MRRQGGAYTVDLDTQEGIATYTLARPQTIDFGKSKEAATAAAYTITKIDLEVDGRTLAGECDTCGEVTYLEVRGTGQRFEIAGEMAPGTDVCVLTNVQGWDTDHPRLEVLELHEHGLHSSGD